MDGLVTDVPAVVSVGESLDEGVERLGVEADLNEGRLRNAVDGVREVVLDLDGTGFLHLTECNNYKIQMMVV